MDHGHHAGTGMRADHRAKAADHDLSIGIDRKNTVAGGFRLFPAVSMRDHDIVGNGSIQRSAVALGQERSSLGQTALLGDADKGPVIRDLEDGLDIENWRSFRPFLDT